MSLSQTKSTASSGRALWMALVVFTALQLPALRDLYKFIPRQMFIISHVSLAAAFLVYFFFIYGIYGKSGFMESLCGRIDSKYVFIFLCAGLIALAVFVYPVVDALKYSGRGSDQDDAMITAGLALLKGGNPYGMTTPIFGNPISPGPGWILLALPFAALGIYHLFAPAALIAAGLVLRGYTGGWKMANFYIITLFSSILSWDLLVEGSDLMPLASVFVILLLMFYYTELTRFRVVALSVITGMAATSRLSFFYLPLLFALIISERDGRAALRVALIGMVTMISFHLFFYLWSRAGGQFYHPFHLAAKGGKFLPGGFRLLALFVSAATAAAIVFLRFRSAGKGIDRWFLYFAAGLYAPLFFVSMGDLIFRCNFNLALWEGANYLMPPMPAIVAYALFKLLGNGVRQGDSQRFVIKGHE